MPNPYASTAGAATITATVSGNDNLNDLRNPGGPEVKGSEYGTREVTRRLLRYMRPRAGLLVAIFASSAVSVVCQLYVPVIIGRAIDAIVGAGRVDMGLLAHLLVELAVVVVAASALQWVQGVCVNRLSYTTVRDMRIEANDKLSRMPLSLIDHHAHGDYISRVVNDVDQVGDGLLQGLTQLFGGVVTIVATLGFMLATSVPMAVIVMLVTPLSMAAAGAMAKFSGGSFARQMAIQGRLSAYVEEYVGAQRLVSAFAYGDRAHEGFAAINEELYGAGERAQFLSSLANPGTRFVNNLVYAVVAVAGFVGVVTGFPASLTVGGVQMFLSYANQYTKPFNEISGVVSQIQGAYASARRVFSLLDAPEEDAPSAPGASAPSAPGISAPHAPSATSLTTEACSVGATALNPGSGGAGNVAASQSFVPRVRMSKNAREKGDVFDILTLSDDSTAAPLEGDGSAAAREGDDLAAVPLEGDSLAVAASLNGGDPVVPLEGDSPVAGASPVRGDVVFGHVDFSYAPDRPLLQDICLHVRPGMRVALVGPTGCGKTTLINLLLRFYDIDAGDIRIDGTSIRTWRRDDLRRTFGMVLQESWLFEGTVHDNIAYGRPEATREEVEAAARRAHADAFIRALPAGYDTVLPENGGSLSQGQRQLLCIARVMLTNPAILLLDEATSSIDTRTELQVQQAFDELMCGRTSLVVAHRLSTIRDADCILVMRAGRIVESGTHAELLAAGGFYSELYNSQFATMC